MIDSPRSLCYRPSPLSFLTRRFLSQLLMWQQYPFSFYHRCGELESTLMALTMKGFPSGSTTSQPSCHRNMFLFKKGLHGFLKPIHLFHKVPEEGRTRLFFRRERLIKRTSNLPAGLPVLRNISPESQTGHISMQTYRRTSQTRSCKSYTKMIYGSRQFPLDRAPRVTDIKGNNQCGPQYSVKHLQANTSSH